MRTVYIADDGKEFDNEFDCEHHEWMLNHTNLKYIKIYDIPIASVYGEIKQDEDGKYYTTGCNRTGCVFCGFGCHLEKEPNRFQQLKETHPKLYEYCMKPWDEGGLGLDEVLNYINVKH